MHNKMRKFNSLKKLSVIKMKHVCKMTKYNATYVFLIHALVPQETFWNNLICLFQQRWGQGDLLWLFSSVKIKSISEHDTNPKTQTCLCLFTLISYFQLNAMQIVHETQHQSETRDRFVRPSPEDLFHTYTHLEL